MRKSLLCTSVQHKQTDELSHDSEAEESSGTGPCLPNPRPKKKITQKTMGSIEYEKPHTSKGFPSSRTTIILNPVLPKNDTFCHPLFREWPSQHQQPKARMNRVRECSFALPCGSTIVMEEQSEPCRTRCGPRIFSNSNASSMPWLLRALMAFL